MCAVTWVDARAIRELPTDGTTSPLDPYADSMSPRRAATHQRCSGSGIVSIPWLLVEFEFNMEKSMANRAKHGIGFVEAQSLWDDPDRVEVPARTVGESRSLVIGRIGEQHWSAVVTYRDGGVRIISVRRSRAEEASIYGEDEG